MTWKTVHTGTGFALDVEYTLTADSKANTTLFRVKQIRLRSRGSSYWTTYSSGLCKGGVATITGQRKTQSLGAVNVSGNGSQTFNVTDDTRTLSHNSSGVCTSDPWVHGYYSSPGGSSYGLPNGWYSASISVPDIDRRAPTTTLSLASSTINSITLKIGTNFLSSTGSYTINGGGATNFTTGSAAQVSGGGSYNKTFSGLSPNTTYTIAVRHKRDHNDCWGSYKSISVTTPKPAAPTQGSIRVVSATPTSITVSVSGFAYGAGAGAGYYQYYKNGSSYTTSGSGSLIFSSLSPNTTYTFGVRLVDNYGSASGISYVSYTTPKPAAPKAGSISCTSSSPTSLTFTASGYSATSPASISGYQWNFDNGGWVGGSNSITKSGLVPNTAHSMKFRVYDNYSTYSSEVSLSANTPKPAAPTISSFTTGTITGTSIQLNFNGAYGSGYPSSYNNNGTFTIEQLNGSSWNAIQKVSYSTKTITVNGLNEETEYQFRIKLTDYYGSSSAYTTLKATTPFVGKRAYVGTPNGVKYGIIYVKAGGKVARATEVYIKVGGTLKKI